MRRRGDLARALLGLVCGVGALCGAGLADARADWTNVSARDATNPGHREPFCLFFSGPSCTHSLSLDGVGAYQRSWNNVPVDPDYGRLAAEIGYMVHVGRTNGHLGLAFEAGGAFNDDDVGWHLIPKLRGRIWLGYSLFALEVSPGFVFESHGRKTTGQGPQRYGAHGELGFSIAGAFTVFGGGEWLTERDGTQSANLIVGGRLLLPVFLELLSRWR